MRCAKCGSTNITIDMQQKSKFSWGKGFVGALVFGAGGATAGIGGKSETIKTYHCMVCGNIGDYSHVVMDGDTDASIESALRCNDVAKLQGLKRQYRNIEWTPPIKPAPTYSVPITATPQNIEAPRVETPQDEFEIDYGVLKKYHGKNFSVEIPNGVIGIGDKSFEYCKSILSVVIPNSVTFIGDRAFNWCSNLTSVVIPNSVKSIGKDAFCGCLLTSIMIPDSVTTIGDNAFYGCKATSVTIPKSVILMGNDIFGGCSDLETILVEEGNPNYRSEGNCLIRIEDNTLMSGFKNSVIPDYITTIGKRAFFCKLIDKDYFIEIPQNITKIEAEAYSYCRMESVIIPESVTYIGERAFDIGEIAFDDEDSVIKTFTFSDPHGWFIMANENDEGTPVDESILGDPQAAAEFIKNMKYNSYLCKK